MIEINIRRSERSFQFIRSYDPVAQDNGRRFDLFEPNSVVNETSKNEVT